MPKLYVHATDSTFRSSAPLKHYETADKALKLGLASALSIATDEVLGGAQSAIIEVCVADLNNSILLRSAISVSVSTLLPN